MYIELTRGKVAIVDDDDYPVLIRHSWYCTVNGYAATRIYNDAKGDVVLMHRMLLEPPPNAQVDHINHDTLDNRRTNLRIVTSQQNRMNQHPRSDNRSGYKGVCFIPRIQRYRAQIKCGATQRTIGHFKTPEEAALAYNAAAIELFGEYAYLNEVL